VTAEAEIHDGRDEVTPGKRRPNPRVEEEPLRENPRAPSVLAKQITIRLLWR
jgi:hypothetical protein